MGNGGFEGFFPRGFFCTTPPWGSFPPSLGHFFQENSGVTHPIQADSPPFHISSGGPFLKVKAFLGLKKPACHLVPSLPKAFFMAQFYGRGPTIGVEPEV